jgi:hypothetical protein
MLHQDKCGGFMVIMEVLMLLVISTTMVSTLMTLRLMLSQRGKTKLQAVAYEDHLYTRTSHYSYEIIDNKLRIYPTPDSVSPEKFWFRFTVQNNNAFARFK